VVVWDARVISTYEYAIPTWQWVWGPEEPIFPVTDEVQRLRVFGHVRKLSRMWFYGAFLADEDYTWELAAIALVLLGGQAVYRVKVGHLFAYMVLNNPRFVNSPPEGLKRARCED